MSVLYLQLNTKSTNTVHCITSKVQRYNQQNVLKISKVTVLVLQKMAPGTDILLQKTLLLLQVLTNLYIVMRFRPVMPKQGVSPPPAGHN